MQAGRLRYKGSGKPSESPVGVPKTHSPEMPGIPGTFIGGAWHPDMTLSSNRRRQRSELRPHPKEEAMSHALATVLHRGHKAASNVMSACLAPHGERVENGSRIGVPGIHSRQRFPGGTSTDAGTETGRVTVEDRRRRADMERKTGRTRRRAPYVDGCRDFYSSSFKITNR
jgi:hypothetical protein